MEEQKKREQSEKRHSGKETLMGKICDEIITRISPNGEVEYGIPMRQDIVEFIELVAEIEGISVDEAANFLAKKAIEKKMREYPEQIRQQMDAILKSNKN
jgi:hypothetical protein